MKKIELWQPEEHEKTIWVCGRNKVSNAKYNYCKLWEDGEIEVVYSVTSYGSYEHEFGVIDGKIILYDGVFFSKEEAEKHMSKLIAERNEKYKKEEKEKELAELKRLQEKYGNGN